MPFPLGTLLNSYRIPPADPCDGQQAHNPSSQALMWMIPVVRENSQANHTLSLSSCDLGLTPKPRDSSPFSGQEVDGHSLGLLTALRSEKQAPQPWAKCQSHKHHPRGQKTLSLYPREKVGKQDFPSPLHLNLQTF